MIPLPETCVGCPLHAPNKGFSLLEGDGTSGLMVVAESLGRSEERDNLPLRPYAPSGGVFQKALDASHLNRPLLTLTNIIRCKAEAPYPVEAVEHCRQYLDAAIEERQPRFILALGDVPLQELSLTRGTQSELRGFVLPSRYGIPMLGTFHPSRIARGDWKLFGLFMHDIRRAESFARYGVPASLTTNYQLTPTNSEINSYIERLRGNPTLPVAYDSETPELIDIESDGRTLMLIQFSSAAGEAIVLDATQLDAARIIMALPNPKWGWADRTFDRALLRANGFTINGEQHDLMNALAHLQPQWMSSKDETSGEKNIPAKLMSLQSCTSLYFPWERPWKRMVKEADDMLAVVRQYAATDVDMTLRVGEKLFAALHRNELYSGYYQHKFRLSFVLDDMGVRGLPIDRDKQLELREYLTSEISRIEADLQQLIPEVVRSTSKPYKSLPKNLRAALKERALLVPKMKLDYYVANHYDICESLGYQNRVDDEGEYHLVKVLPFNPNSSQQLLRYIEHCGYPVPLHIDSKQPTTGKEAIDQLIESTDDEVLRATRQLRQLSKIKGTYTEGHWTPEADGRVHPEWIFGTASGQLTPRRPNSAQYPQHGALAKKAKACISAEPGHTFIKRDMRSFHARTLAWLSGDVAYWTLSDEDVHSYVAAQFLRLPVADKLLAMSPADRHIELVRIKSEHADVRNLKAKRAILGLGFGMGVEKLWKMNPDAFDSPLDAKALIDLIQSLFPKAFIEYPRSLEKRLKQSARLVSPIKHCRWNWSGDLEQAVSFEPANIAHGHMFDSMLIMQERGLLDRWQLCNMIHDCLIFHCPDELIDECIEGSKEIMERESTVLLDSPLGQPFQCSSDVEIGITMADMQ